MTTHDSGAFEQLFRRLARLLNQQPDAEQIAGYFLALKPFALETVREVADALRDTWRGFGLPPPALWIERAEEIDLTRLREAVAVSREEPWRVECPDCEDTGWRWHSCTAAAPCGSCRHRRLYDHEYVTMCPCRERNRTYQRHHLPAGRQSMRRDVA